MTRTKNLRTFAAVIGATGLMVATSACGSDDDGGGLTDDQQFIVDDVVDTFESFDLTVDRGCVEKIAAQMPDDDARLYVESEGEADGFSAEAEALGAQIESCVEGDLLEEGE